MPMTEVPPAGSRASTVAFVSSGLLAGGALALAFTHWTATSGWAFPWFVAVAVLLLYWPGRLILRGLKLDVCGLEHVVLSITLGIPSTGLVYWLCAYAGYPRLLWAWAAALCLLTVHPRLRPSIERSCGWNVRFSHVALLAVFAATVAPMACSPFHFPNLARDDNGGLSTFLISDVVFHVSVASELTHAVPPRNPVLPDRPLVYHYGMHAVTAAFATFGLGIQDLSARFLPVLFMLMAVLAAFGLARRWLRSEPLAVLAAFLVILGEDFSFVGGPHLGPQQPWAYYLLGMPTVISLYMLNPMLPGLAVLLALLLSLERYLATEKAGWLGVAGLLAPTLVAFKVFAALQLAAALGLTVLVYLVAHRRRAVVLAAAAVVGTAIPFLLAISSGHRSLDVALLPWPYVTDAVTRLGLRSSRLGGLVFAFRRGDHHLLPVLAFFAVALPAYLFLTLGARSAGLRSWLHALVRPARDDAFRFLIAAFVLIGPPLSMLVTISAAGYFRREFYNNAGWFFVQSKYLMWLFALEPLRRLTRGWAIAAGLLIAAISVPSTIQYLLLTAETSVAPSTKPLAEAVSFLNREARPGSSCFAREGVAQVVLVSTACRAFALGVFPSSFLSPAEVDALKTSREAFWQRWREQPTDLPDDVLSRWSVDYVISEIEQDGRPAAPASRGATLELSFANDGFAVYRVHRTDSQGLEN